MPRISVIAWVLRLLGGVPLEEILNPSSFFFWFYNVYGFDLFFFVGQLPTLGGRLRQARMRVTFPTNEAITRKGKERLKGKKVVRTNIVFS